MSELREIRFDNNYPKLHGQKYGLLVMVIQDIEGSMLLNEFELFTIFDTTRTDGKRYNIEPDKKYMLLMFVGNKNIMFSSLRKQNEANVALYAKSVGVSFRIIIES